MKISPLVLFAASISIFALFLGGWQLGRQSSSQFAEDPRSHGVRSIEASEESAAKKENLEDEREAIPSLVRRLIDPSLHLDEQMRAVHELPSDLSEREFSALADLMFQPQPENTSLAVWSTIVNELMNVLREPRFQWSSYGQVVADIMNDRHLEPVIRDYAAQHLARWLSLPQDFHPEDSLQKGMASFVQLLSGSREAKQSVTGTALLSLCDLRRNRGEEAFDSYSETLDAIVHQLAVRERACSLPNHLAAIQAAGRMKIQSALPTIREFARSEETNASIRLNCVAALGYYGASEDTAFLQELAQSEDKLRFAAQSALANQSLNSPSL